MKNYSDVPEEQTEIDEAKAAMRYNADVEFQISTYSELFYGIVGLWARVTIEVATVETTLFVGQISDNDLNLKSLIVNGIMAYGIDGCLNHQGAIGSYCYDVDEEINQFDAVPPHFNPNNRPNKGALSGGVNPFDYSLYKNITVDDNYWKPSSVVTYLLNRLNYQTSNLYPTEKRYEYFSTLTGTQIELDEDDNVFTYEQRVQDLKITDQSIWAILVQMVEENGSFTLTIKYNGENPRITVVEL